MTDSFAVAYCFDSGFSNYAAVSTLSLIANTARPPRIYWCVPQEMTEQTVRLLDRSSLGKIADIQVLPLEVDVFADWKTGFHFAPSNYYRLLLPERIPESRILYLDSDTLVVSDISELFSVDLNSNVLAAVPEPSAGSQSRVPRRTDDVYVNTGVLVLNADFLRREGFFERCKGIHAQFKNEIMWADQCVINKYAEGRKTFLADKWNKRFFANSLNREQVEGIIATDDSAILHFIGPVKPWHGWCSPRISEFWFSYAKRLSSLNIEPSRVDNFERAMQLATVLDKTESFKEASELKSRMIELLVKKARKASDDRANPQR